MLAINLEPVYGILLAALLVSDVPQFYEVIILGTVLANGAIKARKELI